MTTLNNLKLITSARNKSISPIVHRRNKLISKLDEQLQIATSKRDGTLFAPKRIKIYTDNATGERKSIEITKRLKEWYWTNEAGKLNLSVRYGSAVLPLNKKGANAIELTNGTELIGTLHKLKDAVIAGEFDDAISEVSDATRKAFNK